jgi:hypothetical protein
MRQRSTLINSSDGVRLESVVCLNPSSFDQLLHVGKALFCYPVVVLFANMRFAYFNDAIYP